MPGLQFTIGNTLAGQCRGAFTAINPDGTFSAFAGTATKLYGHSTNPVWNDASFQKGGVATVNITTVGSGGTNGTYTTVALSGGTGSGAQATIIISGNVVTSVTITAAGTNYTISDVLSASPGSVSGFTCTVATLSGASTQSYSTLNANAQWQFCQFNQTVIAVSPNAVPQYITLPFVPNSSFFAPLAGSPPTAAYCAVINRFLVLSGLTGNASRIQWSDADAITTWTPGIGQADFQDLPDGGNALAMAGFDLYGVVFQSLGARLLTYIGGDIVFQITKITGGNGNGLLAPYGVAVSDDRVFWLSNEGIKMLIPGGAPQPVGKEKVDRTLVSSLSTTQLQNVLACSDPQSPRVVFSAPTANTVLQFEFLYLYDWVLDRWSQIKTSSEFLAVLYQSTLALGSFDPSSHGAYTFTDTANNLEAVLETAEQGTDNQRIFVRGFRPITDAQSVFGSISYRDTPFSSGSTAGGVATMTKTASGSGGVPGVNVLGVALSGGSGTGLTADIGLDDNGNVSSFSVSFPGSGYLITSIRTAAVKTAGSGGTPGTYTSVPLTGGTGSGAIATIVVGAGGTVSTVTITTRGSGYLATDTLSAASGNIGSTTGFTARISALADTTSLTGNAGGNTTFTLEVATLGPNYTAEANPNQTTGIIPFRKETRYSRARIRIPVSTVWKYAKGVEPDGELSGYR
jgi:hypothetical protein